MAFYAVNDKRETCGHKHRTEEAAQKCVDGKQFTTVAGYKRAKYKSRATRYSEAQDALNAAAGTLRELKENIEALLDDDEEGSVDEIAYRECNPATALESASTDLDNAKSEVESLKEEVEQWRDGMSGTNLENSNKYQMLDDAASALDDCINEIESAEIPEEPEELTTEAIQTFCEALDNAADYLENAGGTDVEFPGMYD